MAVVFSGNARIGVVSGNTLFLHQFRKLLAGRQDYELQAIDDWDHAEALIVAAQPDLVVVELGDDQVAGRMLVEALAENAAAHHIPLIAMVGMNRLGPLPSAEDEHESMLAYRFGDLLRRIDTVLEIHPRPLLDAAA